MKKNKALNIFMLSVLSFSTFSSVLANEVTSDGSSSTTITKEISSSYSVLIPQSVNLTSDNASISVQAKGNIEPDKELSVTTTNEVVMTRANDTDYSGKATVSLESTVWNSTTLTNEYDTKNGTIAFPEAKAGSYTGTLNFDINLKDTSQIISKQDVGETPNQVFATTYKNGYMIIEGTGVLKSGLLDIDSRYVTSISFKKGVVANANSNNLFSGGGDSIISIDMSNLDTSNVTDMSNMFDMLTNLKTVNLSNIDTSMVTNFSKMFSGCENLTSLDLSNFNTSNVTNIKFMFSGCSSLETLNLLNWDISKITNMEYAFDLINESLIPSWYIATV